MLNDSAYLQYEVTPLTMAVFAQENEFGGVSSRIIEGTEEYIINQTPSKVIDFACRFFGSSLRGRQEGTRDICGITHKSPISIDPSSGMYFFPTSSPANSKCSWIAHSYIDQVNKSTNHGTELIFKNGKKVLLDISFGSMLNQVQRTAQYRFLLDNRIKHLQRHMGGGIVAEPNA